MSLDILLKTALLPFFHQAFPIQPALLSFRFKTPNKRQLSGFKRSYILHTFLTTESKKFQFRLSLAAP
jgi:hypothetical protein